MKIALYNFKVLKIKTEVDNMKKINVLQVCSYLGLGGIEKSLQIITKYLDKNIFNVSVCVLVPGGIREKAIKEMGVRVYNADKSPEKFVKLIKDKKNSCSPFPWRRKGVSSFHKSCKGSRCFSTHFDGRWGQGYQSKNQ